MAPVTARRYAETVLELVEGDITEQAVDAIVNAANSSLMGGGGVDGAIHRCGGPTILEECRAIRARRGPLPAGQAVITTGGGLAARHVLHTVGPVWQGGRGGEPEILAQCYRNCLTLAAENGVRSLAFPSISTGAYGYPVGLAARVALSTVSKALVAGVPLALVRFVLFSRSDLEAYQAALDQLPT